MSSQKKFYITTPIYYVNAEPHIGHAYTTVAADILARYHRLKGKTVFFATGTDEHGAKIEEKAREEKKEPKEFTDEVAAKYQVSWDSMGISYDRFIRTTEPEHIRAVQNALQFMYDKGDIYLGKYDGLYCRGCEQYKSEKDLVECKCPDHGIEPDRISEESYMFKMSRYADKLFEKIKYDKLKIRPYSRKNEIMSFYRKDGLKDISFSRKNVAWGIPLPWDSAHTAYVWSDAFLNYLTILNWQGLQPEELSEQWPPDLQLMSKDIIRVHATIWPAMLLSLELPLPKKLFVHGFFLIDGKKMSKSIGNVIAPDDLVKRYGSDASRYLLASAAHFGRDGDISWKKLDEKYNADLANGIGNLVARVIGMTEKYFESKVPSNEYEDSATVSAEYLFGVLTKQNNWTVSEVIDQEVVAYQHNMRRAAIDECLAKISRCVKILDNYISEYKPFKLIKEDTELTAAVLYNCLESIRVIALMAHPYMPDIAESIWDRIGLKPSDELKIDFEHLKRWGRLKPGVKVKKGEPLFPRIHLPPTTSPK